MDPAWKALVTHPELVEWDQQLYEIPPLGHMLPIGGGGSEKRLPVGRFAQNVPRNSFLRNLKVSGLRHPFLLLDFHSRELWPRDQECPTQVSALLQRPVGSRSTKPEGHHFLCGWAVALSPR